MFHLAAQSSVVVTVENPALDFEHNILQPIKLIQVLLKSNCNKLVFTSSGGTIFGEPSIILQLRKIMQMSQSLRMELQKD